MAEVLVWVLDKQPLTGDPTKDRHFWQAGDVITIEDDGHPWSVRERSNPAWKIVRFPGRKKSALSQFVATDLGYLTEEGEKLSQVLRRRVFRMKVEAAGDEVAKGQDVAGLMEAKPALQDPKVLGDVKPGTRGVVFG